MPPGDFTRAVGFLEANTGIESHLELMYPGYVGSPHDIHKAFQAWWKWFASNYPYLYWDPENHLFQVDLAAKAAKEATTRPRGPSDGQCFEPLPSCKELFDDDPSFCESLGVGPEKNE